MKYAIRVDADTLLAVPPMHPATPRATRVRVLEYVLRRQIGLAHLLADDARDTIEHRGAVLGRIASLMGETPHRNQRGMGLAA